MFQLRKEKIKEIPFRDGIIMKIQIGYLDNCQGDPVYRYSRSIKLTRAKYRVTIQPIQGDDYVPYVFDIIRSSPTEELSIRPENEAAQAVWESDNELKKTLITALNSIYQIDIENQKEPETQIEV